MNIFEKCCWVVTENYLLLFNEDLVSSWHSLGHFLASALGYGVPCFLNTCRNDYIIFLNKLNAFLSITLSILVNESIPCQENLYHLATTSALLVYLELYSWHFGRSTNASPSDSIRLTLVSSPQK